MGKFGGNTTRNHGYGRSMAYAGKEALRDHYGGGHFGSQTTQAQRWGEFADWARENGIRDARDVTAQAVADYAASLVERGNATSTVQNAVSAINVVMNTMRDGAGGWERVSPSELAGSRTTVRTEAPATYDRSVLETTREQLIAAGHERAATVLELAREFGVRREEAAKADLDRWSREASSKEGKVNVVEGTKGGREAPRWVEVTERSRAALERALGARPEGSRNLIAPGETYKAFKGVLDEARGILKQNGISGYHDARAAYACERYEQITGKPAPVVAGERLADKAADRNAREEIANELGHGRPDVAAAYVGSAR